MRSLYSYFVNIFDISLKSKTPNVKPIVVHHCCTERVAKWNNDCMLGTNITISVNPMTKKIVSHNQRLLKNRSTNNLLPERTENIITNCEKIITAKVIVRAASSEVCAPIRLAISTNVAMQRPCKRSLTEKPRVIIP